MEFTRKILLRHPEVLIEAICSDCGLSIIASSPSALEAREAEHRKQCAVSKNELPRSRDDNTSLT